MTMEAVGVTPRWGAFPFTPSAVAFHEPPEFLEMLPVAIYACDRHGRILWFNSRATEIWGRKPRLRDDSEKYCGSYRLFFDEKEIARHETPMAAVLRTGIAVHGLEGRVERPDGSSVWATVNIEPVKDEDGRLIGAINCFQETTAMHDAAAAMARRRDEQAALYEFTEQLQHAVSPAQLYDLAITAIIHALNCQRAAVLLFDQNGVMRFVASRGLSEGYRRAVEGHSPWRPDSRDAQPVCIDD